MKNLRTQRIVLAIAGILMILCAGLYFYNYLRQTELSQRLLRIELKINELDRVYKNYLTSVLEKRRFLFNPNQSYSNIPCRWFYLLFCGNHLPATKSINCNE